MPARLSKSKVLYIEQLLQSKAGSQREIARMVEVDATTVRTIAQGRHRHQNPGRKSNCDPRTIAHCPTPDEIAAECEAIRRRRWDWWPEWEVPVVSV